MKNINPFKGIIAKLLDDSDDYNYCIVEKVKPNDLKLISIGNSYVEANIEKGSNYENVHYLAENGEFAESNDERFENEMVDFISLNRNCDNLKFKCHGSNSLSCEIKTLELINAREDLISSLLYKYIGENEIYVDFKNLIVHVKKGNFNIKEHQYDSCRRL